MVSPPSDLRRRDFRRILILKPSSLGDVLHTLPLLVKLRRRYPEARIDWLLAPALAELVRHHPALTGVVPFSQALRSWQGVAGLGRLLLAVRRTRYDLVLDLYGRLRSALVAVASGAAVRIGFDRPRRDTIARSSPDRPREAYRNGWTGAREGSWLACTHRVRLPSLDLHALDRYLLVGDLLGLDDEAPQLGIPIPHEAGEHVGALLRGHGVCGPYSVLVPGTTWGTKHWRGEAFAEVGRHLGRLGGVVVAGTGAERGLCQRVVDGCPGAVNLAGHTTLSQLAALLRGAAGCVTNDSGSMHLAVALGTPVVSVFGPTDPLWVGPYRRPEAVVRAGLPCSPCYLHDVSACPHGHACMRDVSAGAVIERARSIFRLTSAPQAQS